MGADKNWFVRLGPNEWKPFTYPRPVDAPLLLLGSVRRGARIGALAITQDGEYVQVNGDYVSPLGAGQIRQALAKARERPERLGASAQAAPAPIVTLKRRRVIMLGA